jgi:hypothetical protein
MQHGHLPFSMGNAVVRWHVEVQRLTSHWMGALPWLDVRQDAAPGCGGV